MEVERNINIDLDQNEITLPKVFQKYAGDFDGLDHIVQFVLRYVETESDEEQIIN